MPTGAKPLATHRLMPPADGNHGTIVVNGRKYTCAVGSTLDVQDFDAFIMMANGWLTAAAGGTTTTSSRPTTGLYPGFVLHDNTLGYNIVWDGKTWRNPTNGAAV